MRRGKRRRWLLAGVLALLVAAGASYVCMDMERIDLNENVRAGLPDESFAKLSDGVTHYQWRGPENGPNVVLVHGFSSPYFVWDKNISALANAGFHVLRYDLYGRGLSDRPRTDYDADLFDRQLLELLDAQNVKSPVDLVGLSMGGSIVMGFADRHPDRVRRLVLFAPAGLNDLPFASKVMMPPGLGECLMRVLGDLLVTRVMPRQVAGDPVALAIFEAAYRDQLQYRGYKRALLSTLRHGPLAGQEDVFARVGRQDRKGLLFWGTKDTVLPYATHERVAGLLPWLEFHAIDGAGHCANYQNANEVNPILVRFLTN